MQKKLESGAKVADVGCGKGVSTLLMAKAFPNSQFFGFDYHDQSIQGAQESAKKQELSDNVNFKVAKAKDYPERATTSSPSSIAFMTWGIPWARLSTSCNR